MDIVTFFLRHTPFWAIPLIFICVEFALLFKVKENIKAASYFAGVAVLCALALVYYYVAGGPEKSVDKFLETSREFKEY
jgi:amino acid permease